MTDGQGHALGLGLWLRVQDVHAHRPPDGWAHTGRGHESENAVNGWRQRYPEIVEGWKLCGAALYAIAERRTGQPVDPWGMATTTVDGLLLPSGRQIRYPGLRYERTDQTWPDGRPKDSWVYGQGRHKAFLTGPKVDENIVQALARDSVFECALRFYKVSRLRPIMRVHDELIYEFPESEAEDLLDTLFTTAHGVDHETVLAVRHRRAGIALSHPRRN